MSLALALRGLALSTLVAFVVFGGAALGGPENGDEAEDPSLRLSRARDKELDERNHEQALVMYRALLERTDLTDRIRGDALLGTARCHRALEQDVELEALLEKILKDTSLPVDVLETAKKTLAELKATSDGNGTSAPTDPEQERVAAQRRARAADFVEDAKRARDEGRFEDALEFCLLALEQDPENGEAIRVQKQVVAATPDLLKTLRDVLRLTSTLRAEKFRKLRRQFDRLEKDGKALFKAGQFADADRAFRTAIRLIDASEFFDELQTERAHSLRWLGMTVEKAEAAGLELGSAPPFPEPTELIPSFQRRLFDLLSELFTARPGEEYPLVLYDASPPTGTSPTGDAGFVAGTFPSGVSVARQESRLSRAEWAETWIRGRLGTGWPTPKTGRPWAGPPRLLDRFGDMLIVQHAREIHAKVRELVDAFPDVSRPMAVDVAVFAATVPGATRIVTQLGARPAPRDTQAALIVPRQLIEDCVPLIEHAEGVQLLGRARLTLGGRPSAVLTITQAANRHPAYQGLPPPALVLTPDESRFGLWLEIYAEDLPHAEGPPRAAVGIRASTHMPQGTVVLPKPSGKNQWQRHARPMAEQMIAATRQAPHSGTVVLQGLSNPFPGGNVTHPGLVLLVGVRPAGDSPGSAAIPDPPRNLPVLNGSGGVEEREYDLGPLATEVADAVLDRAWPQRPLSHPVTAGTQRKARETWLATNLAVFWSRLVEPGAPNPVRIWGRTATARVTPAEHRRLEAAVDALRAQESALYQIEILTAEVTEPILSEWVRAAGARSSRPNTFVVSGQPARQTLEAAVRAAGKAGLYVAQSRLLARATQRVSATNLHTLAIVEDLKVWRNDDGTQRQVPVYGVAEEGLVVLVRPELEADGKRGVTVEVLAAKLRALETLLLPRVKAQAARISVPRHLPVQHALAAERLGDEDAILLGLPHPENASRVVAAYVRVLKVQ